MQLTQKKIMNKIGVGILGVVWVAGLLLAGSDSPAMPWLNLAGTLVFIGASIWLGRVLPRVESSEKNSLRSLVVPGVVPVRQMPPKRRVMANTQYIEGWGTMRRVFAHMNNNSSVPLS